MSIEIRRLRPGDEAVVARLAEHAPPSELLADDRVFFLAAFDGAEPVGFVLAHELPRRPACGIAEGFVIANASNEPAMALCASVGGTRPATDDVVWELRWSRAS